MTEPITMNVRVIGGEQTEVVNALRHAGRIVETRLLGRADTAWTINANGAQPPSDTLALGASTPDGIPGNIWIIVQTPDGPVLQLSLVYAAVAARTGQELLPFVYRDPYDHEEPDRPRPLRRARLVIVDEGIVPEEPANIPVRRQVDGKWQTVMITRTEWDQAEGANRRSTEGSWDSEDR